MSQCVKKYNLHNELYQIIVSKKELYWWLGRCNLQQNLMKFLSAVVDSEEYRRLLTLVAVKFEFIGSLNYVSKADEQKQLKKPPQKTYRRFFEDYCESLSECKMRIGSGDSAVTEKIFGKYRAVQYYCTPMLSTTNEQNYAAEFAGILDYVARHDEFPETEFSVVSGLPILLHNELRKFNWDIFDIHV